MFNENIFIRFYRLLNNCDFGVTKFQNDTDDMNFPISLIFIILSGAKDKIEHFVNIHFLMFWDDSTFGS